MNTGLGKEEAENSFVTATWITELFSAKLCGRASIVRNLLLDPEIPMSKVTAPPETYGGYAEGKSGTTACILWKVSPQMQQHLLEFSHFILLLKSLQDLSPSSEHFWRREGGLKWSCCLRHTVWSRKGLCSVTAQLLLRAEWCAHGWILSLYITL